MWFRIIKQGKILTMPKTQLRIKTPDKVEEERTCKDKVLRLNEKLKNEKSILQTAYNTWDSEQYITDYGSAKKVWDLTDRPYEEDYDKNTRAWRIVPSKDSPASKHFKYRQSMTAHSSLGAKEVIAWSDESDIESIPEKVCCAALDFLQSVQLGENRKEIDGWIIFCFIEEDDYISTSTVEHHRTVLVLELTIMSMPSEGAHLSWSIEAPSDWIEGQSVDWR